VVGGVDDLAIVFDDDEGISEVAEAFEGGEEAVIVAGVEADGGFIEDVEDASESGAELGSEADALGFAAGEGGGAACEGEVTESDIDEEAEPFADFAEEVASDACFVAGEGEMFEEVEGLIEGPAADLVEREAVELDGGGVVTEAGSEAGVAFDFGHEALESRAVDEGRAFGFLEGGDEAFELEGEALGGEEWIGRDIDPAVARALEEDTFEVEGEFIEGEVEVETEGCGSGVEHVSEERREEG
jgi:hypothetical protein